jgi:hypothetical protein
MRLQISLGRMGISSGGLHDARDRLAYPLVSFKFLLQLLPSGSREAVITGTAIFRSFAPFARQPTFDQHALKGRIQRSFLHLKDIGRGLLDKTGNLKAMQFAAAGESFEDQHIEGSGRNLVSAIGRRHDIDSLCIETWDCKSYIVHESAHAPDGKTFRLWNMTVKHCPDRLLQETSRFDQLPECEAPEDRTR